MTWTSELPEDLVTVLTGLHDLDVSQPYIT
jgi:hypothetical protein